MKRIVILFLSVVLLFTTLVFSASAESAHVLNGSYTFKDTITFVSDVNVDFVITLMSGTDVAYSGVTSADGALYGIKTNDSGISQTRFYTLENGWADPSFQTWKFNNAEVTEGFYSWVTENTTLANVGGESTQNPVSYPSDLPLPPSDALGNNREIIIMRTADGTKLYSYSYEIRESSGEHMYYVWGNSNNKDVTLEATYSGATGSAYVFSDGEWKYSGILSGDYKLGKYENILYSSVIIYDQNGEYFFPLTLWAQILKVEQGGLKMEIPKLESSMGLLVVCGIGLLALLIGLALLPKVLYKFL